MDQEDPERAASSRSRTAIVLLAIVAVAWIALGASNRPKGASWPGILLDQASEFDVESASVSKLEYRWGFPAAVVLRGYFVTESGPPFHVEARRDAPFLGWRTQRFAQGSAAMAAWEE
ncbi:MAG: hypothetical protein AAGI22_30275 [Planctomycetota bacterium]